MGIFNEISLFALIPMIFWIAVGVFFIRFRYQRRMRQRSKYAQKDSKGRDIELTTMGKLDVLANGSSSSRSDYFFQMGLDKPAPTSLSTTILKPSKGIRSFTVLGVSVVLILIWSPLGAMYVPDNELLKVGLSAAVLYAMINMLIYQASYDRQVLSIPNWLFQQREYNWKDLVSIKDNGHYLYVLQFTGGRKAELHKYLVGIPDFLSYANDRIDANLTEKCLSYPK